MTLNLAWIYLFIASCCEIAWMYCVKYISKDKLMHMAWGQFFTSIQPVLTLVPLIGYIILGLLNIYFFSSAMKVIPASTAFAVWTGVALVGAKLVDTLAFGEPINLMQMVYFAAILIGIIGLKSTTAA